jgi:prepilin signal peptidase PulO-like enzyme (type II secretory pathway)
MTLLTLLAASLIGSVVGLSLIAAGRGSMKYALPFGCFLAVGAVFSAAMGQPILDWYLGFF